MAVYKGKELEEQSIYGSSRLGLINYASKTGYRSLGGKKYELSNHLGNVLAVVSDNIHLDQDSTWTSLINTTDYYPFGLAMDGRSVQDSTYRYGFNGKEKDSNGEWGGQNNHDYGFRIYNPSIAKFLSVDPLAPDFPWYTPYQYAGNKPIFAVDIDGLEEQQAIDGSIVSGPVNMDRLNKEIVKKALNTYFSVMSIKPTPAVEYSPNQTFIGPNNSTFEERHMRNRRMEVAMNYQNLQNSIPAESRLIGQGIGIGLSVAPIGGGIGLLARGMRARSLISAGRAFGTGFGINASTQFVFSGGDFGSIDFADSFISGASSLITRKYGANLILDAALSSTVDLTVNDGLNTVFNGSKSQGDALVDFAIGIGTGILSNKTESFFSVDSDKARAVLKNFNPALKKVMIESIKAIESGSGSKAGEKIKEKVNEP